MTRREHGAGEEREERGKREGREVTDQLRELADAGVALSLPDRPSRCGACNGPVEDVAPDASTPAHAPDPAEQGVWRCVDCGQHFWKGSHWDRVARALADL